MAASPSYDRDAYSIIIQTLKGYGLHGKALSDWVIQSLKNANPIEQILLELEQRPEYDQAFPEIRLRREYMAKTGVDLEPIGPAEILEYRTRAKELMRSFGLPEVFWDENRNFADLIVKNVSLAELNERLELSSRRVQHAPPEVKAIFGETFGVNSERALYLLFTNSDKALPALEEMVQQAEAGGAARRLGFGLDAAAMARMAELNISYDQAVEGFGALAERRSLFDETLSETADFTVSDQGLAAAFNIGDDTQALARRGETRAAATAGSSGSLTSEEGVQGLGAAGRR
jgi:hypothetical protein